MGPAPRPPLARFLEKIEDTGSCWLWTAARFSNGYGAFRVGAKQMRAHRWAYEHFNGPIESDLVVMHSCDVRHCVNPEHLSLGTPLENQQDMTAKGRGRVGDTNGWRRAAPKLTAAKAAEIRDAYTVRGRVGSGRITQWELAERYGISQGMVSDVLTRKAWT